MRVFIAEKPALGAAIAACLPGPQRKDEGYIQCGANDTVTWAFGHLYEQAEPDDYLPDDIPRGKNGRKRWRMEDLPILPDQWRKEPKPKAAKQLKVIRGLLKNAANVVHAGDPGREGQLLIDEILEAVDWRGPTQRIWLASQDETSVARALAGIKDNAEFVGLRDAAEARARADWLIGMNMTRAMTLSNSGGGLVSVGRVQTPTLALIVARDQEIEDFQPHPFYVPQLVAAGFVSNWKPSATDGSGFDPEGRLIDKARADALASAAKAAGTATVDSYKKDTKRQEPPLGLSLSELQKICSARFGMTAKQVLDIGQVFWDNKLTSYPRSDCRYLPDEQHGDAAGILGSLSQTFEFARSADPARRSPTWNTAKVGEHHAIIPTGNVPSQLSDAQAKVYEVVCRSYVAQFYPEYAYDAVAVTLTCADEAWNANGRKIVTLGWREVFGDRPVDAELPALSDGQVLAVEDARVEEKKTTAPARFTEGTLIDAMSGIHRFVEDAEAKAKLKETSGLGTVATRPDIIEKLKNRGFLLVKGKQLISAPAGRTLISALPPVLTDPVTTARWEDVLSDIAAGQATLAQFEAAQREQVVQLVEQAKSMQVQIGEARAPGGGKTNRKPPAGPACPDCRAPTITLKTKAGKAFYKCESCRSCWWPGFKNAKTLGKKWESR
ncbi:MAG: DNA topoisomerase 3 [Acidihalobacter sp.]|uniref:DNA topoisomerase 3 n=1 Tax=Acidihalobacter sp. TaxID=1872108 RepID=UPI00307D6374